MGFFDLFRHIHANKWFDKGNDLKALGKLQEAIVCYNEALKIDPKHANAWVNLGNTLDDVFMLRSNDLREHQEPIVCYDKALEIKPRLANAWYNKGLALASREKPQEAIECLERFIELAPSRLASHIEIAKVTINDLKNSKEGKVIMTIPISQLEDDYTFAMTLAKLEKLSKKK